MTKKNELIRSGIISVNDKDISDGDLLIIKEDAGDEGTYNIVAQVRYEKKCKSWQVWGEANYKMNLVEIDNDNVIVVDRRFTESILTNKWNKKLEKLISNIKSSSRIS